MRNPILFVSFDLLIACSLVKVSGLIKDYNIVSLLGGSILPLFTALTLIFYLLAAFTNPGYIIGNEET